MNSFEEMNVQERMEHRWPFLLVAVMTPLAFIVGIIGWRLLLVMFVVHSLVGR